MKHPFMVYAMVFSGTFLVTVLLVPIFRWCARRLDIVDRPSAKRKIHKEPIPYLGGVPFYICFLGTVLFIELFYPQFSQDSFYPMAFVGTIIVLMGLYDDVSDMSSLKKLILELALGVVLFFWGFKTMEMAHPLGGTWHVGWLAIVVTPLWIAGIINAVNFSDGMDGLAGGLVFICALSIFIISLKSNQIVSCILMVYLMGTTAGFLVYNFHPASVFMGDAGALFLGFILGTSTLIEQQKGVAVIALAAPMVVMAIPFLDTALSFYRRMLRAREGKFFMPDRDHLHHRLLDLGLTQRQVVLSMYYVSAFMGLMAFIVSGVPGTYAFLALVLAAMAILFGVVVLRFIEGLANHHD
ncbi:MAG TPA: MraY family glycosyltransferase [Candidatus Hydrogenedentes bacterium]|nr:MraY family glycosyltransferase [Candidatus Hydrogenedentota bacterium]